MNALLTFGGRRLLPYFAICCMLIGIVGPTFAIFPPPTPPPTSGSGSTPDGGSPPPPNPGDGSGHTSGGPPASGTPEPGTLVLALTGSGAAALAFVRRRRVDS